MSKSIISKSTIQRLLRDVKQIMKSPLHDNGVYYQHDEDDMLKGYAMIIGAEDTPYYGGYYFFEFFFPPNYPHSPPRLRYLTNGDGVRFNPNLYKTGKVCISVLNTWRGDQWTSCQTISSILLTLCTVLCKDPMLNEPGITQKHRDFKSYNTIIEYKNVEVAMLSMVNKRSGYYLDTFDRFYPVVKEHFVKNVATIQKHIDGISSKYTKTTDITSTSIYSMTVTTNYSKLKAYFIETCENMSIGLQTDSHGSEKETDGRDAKEITK